jgi:excisionase family DNA binding protein
MLTVPEAARRVGRNPETVRRWIRSGRLRSQRVGTQHLVDGSELDRLVEAAESIDVPAPWRSFPDGADQPDWTALVRESRDSH